MSQVLVPRILATASGAGRSSWRASAPPIGLALLAVLYVWISGMTLLGDALLLIIKVAAALLAVAWASAALRRRFGRGLRPRAVVAALAIVGLGAAGAVWMFPGVWIVPTVPLLSTRGIVGAIPAVYIVALALVCAIGYIAYRRFSGFRVGAVTRSRERIAADCRRGVVRVRKPRPAMLERPRRTATLPEAPTEPVELRFALTIAPGGDAEAAAALVTKAITEMTHSQGIPAAVCTRHHNAAGGVVLDIRFHVRDLRRGRAHVLADAQALLWDVLHAHRIPFALRPPASPSGTTENA